MFPLRLFALLTTLEKEGQDDIMGWQCHGRAFKIRDRKRLEEEILPKYMGAMKASSLMRQLNIYGFIRISSGADCGSYYHEKFLRHREFLLFDIRRTQKKGTGARLRANPDDEPDFKSFPPMQPLPKDVYGAEIIPSMSTKLLTPAGVRANTQSRRDIIRLQNTAAAFTSPQTAPTKDGTEHIMSLTTAFAATCTTTIISSASSASSAPSESSSPAAKQMDGSDLRNQEGKVDVDAEYMDAVTASASMDTATTSKDACIASHVPNGFSSIATNNTTDMPTYSPSWHQDAKYTAAALDVVTPLPCPPLPVTGNATDNGSIPALDAADLSFLDNLLDLD